jgi:hypothetical protein
MVMKSGIAIVITTLLMFLSMSLVSAGDCHSASLCGEVNNQSSKYMTVTTSLGSGQHYCNVWNWDGSNPARCEHEPPLAPGSSMGGGNVDVDAFTFADDDYTLSFYGGSSSRKTKGVWTKITDIQEATCNDGSEGIPHCNVYFSL